MAFWNIRYYIDPETGSPHIYNHNVTESEVEDVLANPGALQLDKLPREGICESYTYLTQGRVTYS